MAPTGREVATALLGLAALWVAGRVLVLTPFGWAAAAVNVAFPLAAAVGLAIPFIAARNRRNYFFIGLLALMAAAALGIHLTQLGVTPLPGWIGLQVALDGVLFIMAVMGGRVIPMFTHSIAGTRVTPRAWLEKVVLGSTLVLLLAPGQLVPAVLVSAALWSAGFALYAVAYWPVLTRARVDGKPG